MSRKKWAVAAAVPVALGGSIVLGGGVETEMQAAPASSASVIHHVYRTCSTDGGCGLTLRDGPSTTSARLALMADGDEFAVDCWMLGEPVLSNPVWLQGTWNGQTGVTSDYYIDTTWEATQDLTNQGIPECGTEEGAADLQPTISGEELQGAPSDTQIDVLVTPFVTDGSSAPFDRGAAADWALTHAQDPNPFPAACTWFVTQALWFSGIPENPDWNDDGAHGFIPYLTRRPGTPAATAVEPFISALKSAYPASTWMPLSMTQNAVPEAQVGDLIAYDWEGDHVYDHLAIITGFAAGDYPLVSEWGIYDATPTNRHPSTEYQQRGWTWSEKSGAWLQEKYAGVTAALLHIDTTIPTTY